MAYRQAGLNRVQLRQLYDRTIESWQNRAAEDGKDGGEALVPSPFGLLPGQEAVADVVARFGPPRDPSRTDLAAYDFLEDDATAPQAVPTYSEWGRSDYEDDLGRQYRLQLSAAAAATEGDEGESESGKLLCVRLPIGQTRDQGPALDFPRVGELLELTGQHGAPDAGVRVARILLCRRATALIEVDAPLEASRVAATVAEEATALVSRAFERRVQARKQRLAQRRQGMSLGPYDLPTYSHAPRSDDGATARRPRFGSKSWKAYRAPSAPKAHRK